MNLSNHLYRSGVFINYNRCVRWMKLQNFKFENIETTVIIYEIFILRKR